jgi:hypothetical protein
MGTGWLSTLCCLHLACFCTSFACQPQKLQHASFSKGLHTEQSYFTCFLSPKLLLLEHQIQSADTFTHHVPM